MANRIPLIVNPTAGQIQELPSGDTLLIGNDVDVNGSVDISTNLTLSNNTNSSTRLIVSSTTASTNSTSGSATFAGGVGISGALYVGSTINGTLANDIVVTNSIANDAVTYAKIQDVSDTNKILGRDTAGAGVIEELSPADVRSMINVADGATNVTNNNQLTNGAGYITSAPSSGTVKSAFTHNYAEVTYQSSSYHNGNFGTHLSISLTPSSSNNKIMVASSFQLGRGGSQNNNWVAKAKLTGSGGADLQGSPLVTTNNNTDGGTFFNLMAYDAAGNTNARTYNLSVSWTSNSASNGDIRVRNSALWAIEMNT